MKPTDFAYALSKYFTDYMVGQRNVSVNTIKSYRDTFSLLLLFVSETKGIAPEKFTLNKLTYETVDSFLLWLESERNSSISTRNQRLAALHSFVKYLQFDSPDKIFQCQKILAIPFKKCAKPIVSQMSDSELRHILNAPDSSTFDGRRDSTMLSLLYDTGVRVQELINLKVSAVHLEHPAYIDVFGKGRKERHIPLMKQNKILLKEYMTERKLLNTQSANLPLFTNRQGNKFTRAGISYIIKKYCSDLDGATGRITPHVFRHTKAMHLRRAGINMVYIRDFLGHEELATTEIYAQADAESRRIALEQISDDFLPGEIPSWQKDKGLLEWLKDFGK